MRYLNDARFTVISLKRTKKGKLIDEKCKGDRNGI